MDMEHAMDFVHVTLAMDDRAREACHDLFDVDGGCTAAVLGSIESLDAAVYHWLPTNHFTDRSSGSSSKCIPIQFHFALGSDLHVDLDHPARQ